MILVRTNHPCLRVGCHNHSGLIITNDIGSYEFVGMKNETFLLNEFLTLENLVGLV
jgi:hypothetical protein